MPLERRWVESGRELSTVLQRFTLAEAWCFLLGTGSVALTTHLPITHRLNREQTSGACDAIFKVTGEMKKNDSLSQSASMHASSRAGRRMRLVSELASGTC